MRKILNQDPKEWAKVWITTIDNDIIEAVDNESDLVDIGDHAVIRISRNQYKKLRDKFCVAKFYESGYVRIIEV